VGRQAGDQGIPQLSGQGRDLIFRSAANSA
jgi:hypothetical protein